MAIGECQTNIMSVQQAARAWVVPRSTLQLRLSGKVEGCKHASGRKPLLVRAIIVGNIKEMARLVFSLGMQELRSIAYHYASKNKSQGSLKKKKNRRL